MKKTLVLGIVSAVCCVTAPTVSRNGLSAGHIFDSMGDSCDDCGDECPEEGVPDPDRIAPNPTIEFDMVTYFQHLNAYSPASTNGSCGYVSLIQYLSYLDTFFNDGIIPEQYDRHNESAFTYNQAIAESPGVLRQSYPGDGIDLYNWVLANEDTDYQAKLFHIGNECLESVPGGYTPRVDFECSVYVPILAYAFPAPWTNQVSMGASTDYRNLLNAGNNLVYSTAYQNEIANFVKHKLDLGIPVLLDIVGGDPSYDSENGRWLFENDHGVVAYYYDEDGIHANMGWTSASNDVVVPDGQMFEYIMRAVTIELSPSFPHAHANNYAILNDTYCGLDAHLTHTHSYAYSYVNSSYHRKTCSCGIEELELHIYQEGVCYACGY